MLPERMPFDRVAASYDESRGGEQRGRDQAGFLLPWLRDRGTVLEVGVGTGLVALALTQQSVDVVGVDLSLPMLAGAARRVPGRVAAGDALALPLRDGALGAVVFVHVLHLLPDLRRAFREARRVLAPDGRLVVLCGPDDQAAWNDGDRVVEQLRLALVGPRPDRPQPVLEAATDVGFREEHRGDVTEPEWSTPSEQATRLEQRDWSWTWHVDDATWRRLVVPALDRLRALPEPDRPRPTVDVRTLLVLARDGSSPSAEAPKAAR